MINPNLLFFAKDYISSINRYALGDIPSLIVVVLRVDIWELPGDENIECMIFSDCRCTHPSAVVLKFVTRELGKQLEPKWCDLCYNCIYFYGKKFLI